MPHTVHPVCALGSGEKSLPGYAYEHRAWRSSALNCLAGLIILTTITSAPFVSAFYFPVADGQTIISTLSLGLQHSCAKKFPAATPLLLIAVETLTLCGWKRVLGWATTVNTVARPGWGPPHPHFPWLREKVLAAGIWKQYHCIRTHPGQ